MIDISRLKSPGRCFPSVLTCFAIRLPPLLRFSVACTEELERITLSQEIKRRKDAARKGRRGDKFTGLTGKRGSHEERQEWRDEGQTGRQQEHESNRSEPDSLV